MNEVNGYEQALSTETFTEPQVHPDIDNYFREKLASAQAIKQRQDKVRANKKLAQQLTTLEAHEALLFALRNAGKIEEAEEEEREWNAESKDRSLSPEEEIPRLQQFWRAAARGDFAAVSSEVAQDISNANSELHERRLNTLSSTQEDVRRYDTSVAEIAEWQVSLQETPVDANSRLGGQINRTVVGLIQQRDNTNMGRLNKQIKNLQRVQNAITSLQSLPKGK